MAIDIVNELNREYAEGNSFVLFVCVCACLSVCLSVQAIPFECLDTETSFLVSVVVHLDHIWIKIEYPGHWVKVKVTWVKWLFRLIDAIFFYEQHIVLI